MWHQQLLCLTCRHMWVASKERLNVHFNPASLLSFGDALAFVSTLLSSDVVVLGPQGPELQSSPTHGPGSMARLAAPENAPKMAEQMAVNADLTARIPQKYLIQNQSGLRVYYWAESVRSDARCCLLPCALVVSNSETDFSVRRQHGDTAQSCFSSDYMRLRKLLSPNSLACCFGGIDGLVWPCRRVVSRPSLTAWPLG